MVEGGWDWVGRLGILCGKEEWIVGGGSGEMGDGGG